MVFSQFGVKTYCESGQNNASNGFYLKTAALATYTYKGFTLGSGISTNLISNDLNFVDGVNITVEKKFDFKLLEIGIEPFFIYKPYSRLLHEQNWGAQINFKTKHLLVSLGSAYRKTGFTTKAVELYNILPENRYWIYKNSLIYTFGFNLKTDESKWNFGISATNFDYFLIHQLTNPMFTMNGSYKLTTDLKLFAQSIYKLAGASNGHVDYFGLLIRSGVKWTIN